ncbi:MAG TPA: prepilin-type N-terminal cleavage/methylation domain-containing protein [Candidatus Paceibacterota bacterium]
MHKELKTKIFPKTNNGFSLIEALVAVSILLLAITGTLSIASRSVAYSLDVRDQITASFLGEEAVEFVRNTRDTNVIGGSDWLSGLQSCFDVSGCVVDVPNNEVTECPGACPTILLSSAGVYNYVLGNEAPWRRRVQITETVDGREAVVDVTVSWKRRVFDKSFTIQEHIFNWQ